MGEVNIALVARDCYLGKTNTFSKEDQEKILRGRMEKTKDFLKIRNLV